MLGGPDPVLAVSLTLQAVGHRRIQTRFSLRRSIKRMDLVLQRTFQNVPFRIVIEKLWLWRFLCWDWRSRMTVDQILKLGPELAEYLHEFADCFGRREPRGSWRSTCGAS